MPSGVLCGLETNLQLVPRLDGGANHVHLEPGVSALVEVDPDDQHDVVGHFDAKLAAVGAHDGARYGATAERGQAVGNTAEIEK